jgi:hypothetical protein
MESQSEKQPWEPFIYPVLLISMIKRLEIASSGIGNRYLHRYWFASDDWQVP